MILVLLWEAADFSMVKYVANFHGLLQKNIRFLNHCDQISKKSNFIWGSFILAYRFQGFNPWLLGFLFPGPLWDRYHGLRSMWWESFIASVAAKQREGNHREGPRCSLSCASILGTGRRPLRTLYSLSTSLLIVPPVTNHRNAKIRWKRTSAKYTLLEWDAWGLCQLIEFLN